MGPVECPPIGIGRHAGGVAQLASNLDLGRSMERVAEEERRIEALTPKDVQDAFRRHVDPDRLIIIRAGDFRR